jgi:hypothetical protein
MRRLLVLMLAVLGAACSPDEPVPIGCSSNEQCSEGEVCFAGGCGNPGEGIVVEVRPNPQAGLHAQDFELKSLSGQQNIELADPSVLKGLVSQEREVDSPPSAYSGAVTFRVTGESLLIPGVERRYTSTLTPENGGYQIPVGTGRYTITMTPTTADLPPLLREQVVESGQTVGLDFLLPSASTVTRLSGMVVRQGQVLVDADLEVQAFDPFKRPLSQRVPVQRSTGLFSLALPPSAAKTTNVLIQVTPAATAATPVLVPQKIFSVNPSQPLTLSLAMGDYGVPVTIEGRLVDQTGQPIAEASVYVQGTVGDNGFFHSQRTVTDAQGRFALLSLPSPPDLPLTLYAVPPPRSRAGVTSRLIAVPRAGVQLPEVLCPDKRTVRGSLLMPDNGAPAAGVRVQVETVGDVPGWPRPTVSNDPVRLTDSEGRFELALDPGQYRLDFIPVENLPRVSRLIIVRPSDSPNTPGAEVELPAFSLNKASRVSGVITFGGERFKGQAAGRASIRFFRKVDVEGVPTSVLLAESLTDDSGNYAATLPTR